MIRINRYRQSRGFTLIELLVVIAIIAMLTGILAPGIRVVTRAAKGLKQKSVFHGYETGLELFRKDFDDYPESAVLPDGGTTNLVCGGQHLAEALLGRDLQGFDPKTKWYAPTSANGVYASPGTGATQAQVDASSRRRKELYVELKDDGAYALEDLYGAGNIGNIFSPSTVDSRRSPIMTDIFKRKKITLQTGERIKMGSPVLYFKADQTTKLFLRKDPAGISNHANWIYNYDDNEPVTGLGTVLDQNVKHKFDLNEMTTVKGVQMDGMRFFYETIKNPRVDTYDKPYNAKTFLLISAGWDGVFGTKDDITNFDY